MDSSTRPNQFSTFPLAFTSWEEGERGNIKYVRREGEYQVRQERGGISSTSGERGISSTSGERGNIKYVRREGEYQVRQERGGISSTSGERGNIKYVRREGEYQVRQERGGISSTSALPGSHTRYTGT